MEEKAICDVICKESVTKRIDSFNKILELIHNSESADEVLLDTNNSLTNYNRELAKSVLENDNIYGRAIDKYLILRYEYLNFDDTAVISDYSNLSIEHVLPQNPKENSLWSTSISKIDRDKWTHNIGNLIIISGRKNSSLSNSEFNEKKLKLKSKIKDIFKGSLEVLEENEWTVNTIKNRAKKITKKMFI